MLAGMSRSAVVLWLLVLLLAVAAVALVFLGSPIHQPFTPVGTPPATP
jgi:hypothetical protein